MIADAGGVQRSDYTGPRLWISDHAADVQRGACEASARALAVLDRVLTLAPAVLMVFSGRGGKPLDDNRLRRVFSEAPDRGRAPPASGGPFRNRAVEETNHARGAVDAARGLL